MDPGGSEIFPDLEIHTIDDVVIEYWHANFADLPSIMLSFTLF